MRWVGLEEVLEGGTLNAFNLLGDLQRAVRLVAGLEPTLFGAAAPGCVGIPEALRTFLLNTLTDAASHLRTCQWLDVES